MSPIALPEPPEPPRGALADVPAEAVAPPLPLESRCATPPQLTLANQVSPMSPNRPTAALRALKLEDCRCRSCPTRRAYLGHPTTPNAPRAQRASRSVRVMFQNQDVREALSARSCIWRRSPGAHSAQQRKPTSGDTSSRRCALAGTVSHDNAASGEAKEPPRVRQASAAPASSASIDFSQESSHSATLPDKSNDS